MHLRILSGRNNKNHEIRTEDRGVCSQPNLPSYTYVRIYTQEKVGNGYIDVSMYTHIHTGIEIACTYICIHKAHTVYVYKYISVPVFYHFSLYDCIVTAPFLSLQAYTQTHTYVYICTCVYIHACAH